MDGTNLSHFIQNGRTTCINGVSQAITNTRHFGRNLQKTRKLRGRLGRERAAYRETEMKRQFKQESGTKGAPPR